MRIRGVHRSRSALLPPSDDFSTACSRLLGRLGAGVVHGQPGSASFIQTSSDHKDAAHFIRAAAGGASAQEPATPDEVRGPVTLQVDLEDQVDLGDHRKV